MEKKDYMYIGSESNQLQQQQKYSKDCYFTTDLEIICYNS